MSEIGELLEEFEEMEVFSRPQPAAEEMDLSGMLGSGVYALCRGDKVLYIGKAKLIGYRIHFHMVQMKRKKQGRAPMQNGPGLHKSFIFNRIRLWPCPISDMSALERKMIAKFRPRGNEKLIPRGTSTLEQVGFDLTRLGITSIKATPTLRRTFSSDVFIRRI